jgi:hypothetical protein
VISMSSHTQPHMGHVTGFTTDIFTSLKSGNQGDPEYVNGQHGQTPHWQHTAAKSSKEGRSSTSPLLADK